MTNILFIHGILGHPQHFDFLYPHIPEGYGTIKLLLKGHGGSVKDFASSYMEQWRMQVEETVLNLKRDNHKLLIVAHSMGCLFAIENAIKGNADGLFLINPPMSLRISKRMFTIPFKVATGRINDNWTLAAKEAYSIADDHNPLHYIGWLPRYLELFREIRTVRRITAGIAVPTCVYLSDFDEMVSTESARFFEGIPGITIVKLSDSGHYYYSASDRKILCDDFTRFISQTPSAPASL